MSLDFLAFLYGGVTAVLGAALLAAPRAAAAGLRAFPRHVWAGRLLAGVDIVWSACLLRQAGFAWVADHPALILLAVPAAYALVIVFVDELLAARALGGLLLLVPLPVLESAFVHPSPARLAMTAFAYLLAIAGMVLVWSPYKLRQGTERWIGRRPLARAAGAAILLIGAGLMLLGWAVY